jgi:hypothetical protein
MPYFAMEQMLRGVRDGLFDAEIVRALLKAVSMFPVGSYVDLGESYVGRVIRSTGAEYDRPIVEVWKSSNLVNPPSVVDLTQTDRLKIVRALPSLRT